MLGKKKPFPNPPPGSPPILHLHDHTSSIITSHPYQHALDILSSTKERFRLRPIPSSFLREDVV
jgi:hypothetical protein